MNNTSGAARSDNSYTDDDLTTKVTDTEDGPASDGESQDDAGDVENPADNVENPADNDAEPADAEEHQTDDADAPVNDGSDDPAAPAPDGAENVVNLDDYRDGNVRHFDAEGNLDRINDADYLGTDNPEFDALLERDATLMIGTMRGAKDRRNTQDGDWKPEKLPWARWVLGGPAARGNPAWGFSRHPVWAKKEGVCVVLGESVEGARTAKSMKTMYAFGFDIDSGVKLETALDKIGALGVAAFFYTSFNHGKRGLTLKRDEVLRKLGIKRDPTDDEIRTYLQEHDSRRYEESFIAAVTIADTKQQTKTGTVIVLDTPPLDKFRLIFPLAQPINIIDLAPTHAAALEVWEDKVTGFARNVLAIHFDTSCTDPSRLFYTGRHPEHAEWHCGIHRGEPLAFDAIPPMRKASYAKDRGTSDNPFTAAAGRDPNDYRSVERITESGRDLNEWHRRRGKSGFLIADVIEAHCPDQDRGQSNGGVTVECPFEHEHTKAGGAGCWVKDALDGREGYWVWSCRHDACQGRHKLDFLLEALRAGWFSEDVLDDSTFLLPSADDDDRTEGREDGSGDAADDFGAAFSALTRADFASGTAGVTLGNLGIDADTPDADLRRLARAMHDSRSGGFDRATWGHVVNALKARAIEHPLDRRTLNAMWRDLEAERARRTKTAPMFDDGPEADDGVPESEDGEFEPVRGWLPISYRIRGDCIIADGDEPALICGKFDVVGRSANADGTAESGRIIAFTNENGKQVEQTFYLSDLRTAPARVIAQLSDAGLFIPTGRDETARFVALLNTIRPRRLIPTLTRPGWVKDEHGKIVAFLLGTGELIQRDGGTLKRRLHESVRMEVTATEGTLEGWKRAASAAEGAWDTNPHFLLAICAAGAGALVGITEGDTVGFGFSGRTTTGKTRAQRLGATMFGTTLAGKGVLHAGNSTANAFEDLALKSSDMVLMVDDLGGMQNKGDLGAVLFGLNSGRSKARKSGSGTGLVAGADFRTFVVFSNEASIKAEVDAGGGSRFRGGMTVRFPDFDVGGERLPAETMAAIESCRDNYGHAGPAYLRYLLDSGVTAEPDALRGDVAAIAGDIAGSDAATGIRRGALVFALAQRAGELLVDAGLLSSKEAVRGAVRRAWDVYKGSDEASTANGSESLLDRFRSYVHSHRGRTIIGPDDANEYARGEVVGWYTPDCIYLDYTRVDDVIRASGAFGKRSDLIAALKEIGALVPRAKGDYVFRTLPRDLKDTTAADAVRKDGAGQKAAEAAVKNYRILRDKLGV